MNSPDSVQSPQPIQLSAPQVAQEPAQQQPQYVQQPVQQPQFAQAPVQQQIQYQQPQQIQQPQYVQQPQQIQQPQYAQQPQQYQHQPQQSIEMVPMPVNSPPQPTGIQAFVQKLQNLQAQQSDTVFSAPSKGITAIKLNQPNWIKRGSAVSSTGAVTYTKDSICSKGLIRAYKEWRTGEGMKLMKATPNGSNVILYVADDGKHLVNIQLNIGESVIVKGDDVVAFEESVQWNIEKLKGGLHSFLHGAQFYIRFSGPGTLCIGCHGDPIIMPVTGTVPILVDPSNAVLWTKNTVPSSKNSVNILQKMLGCYRPTGEEKQWAFSGEGFVVVQPIEEDSNSQKSKGFLAKIFGK